MSYCRISLDRRHEEEGVTRQTEDTETLRERRALPPFVDRFVDNDRSATNAGPRPGYDRLMTLVKAGRVDVVLVYMLGRLWRNRGERAVGMEIFRQHKVSVLCVKGPEFDLTTAAGRMLAGLLGEVDTFEVEQMSELLQRQMRQEAEQGLPPGGPRAYGYSQDGWKIIEEEAQHLPPMYEMLLATRKLAPICRDAAKKGLVNVNGKPFESVGTRYMLTNPRYAGLREYPSRRSKSDEPSRLYEGRWPAIVPVETWQAALHILFDASRTSSGEIGTGRKWLLSGVGLCGVCQDGTTVTSGTRGRGAGSPTQPVYVCRKTKHLSRLRPPVDDLVERWVLQRLARKDAVELLVDRSVPDLRELNTKAIMLRARLGILANAFAADDVIVFKDATRLIRERLTEVESQMAHPQRAHVLGDIILDERPRTVWEGLDLDRKRAIISMLLTVVILPGKRGRMRFDENSVLIAPAVGMA